jgi:hypothetical protein
MKTVFVEVDTNDADYVGEIVEVTEETLEHFKPLIEKIKNFKPYCNEGWSHHSNFPVGDCLREDLGEKHPMELYNLTEEEYEYFVDSFRLYGGEWGSHTIHKIQEVTLGEELL